MRKITTFLLLLLLFFGFKAAAQQRNLHIVFIGNSITHGAGLQHPGQDAPPVKAAQFLNRMGRFGKVSISNQGHSGYTTLDFLPGTVTYKEVEQTAHSFGSENALLVFSIMLGTNDSAIKGTHGAPVNTTDYRHNLKTIMDSLLNEFPECVVVINHPLWYSPNTYNGAQYLQVGLDRLQSYLPVIDSLVNEYKVARQHVFLGDTKAFNYFRRKHLTDFQAEQGHQGTFYLHPNAKGAERLGRFWAKAIAKCLSRNKMMN